MGWSTFPAVVLLALLVSCGDASQIDDDRAHNGTVGDPQAIVENPSVRDAQPLSFVPLSSQALIGPVVKNASSAAVRSLLMSSGMGVLPEVITTAAEELGLNVESQTLSLTSSAFLLPEGLMWQPTSTAKLQLNADDEPANRTLLTEMKLTLDGIPVHNAHIKMLNDNGNPTWMTGTVPHWMSNAIRPQTTPFSMDESTIRQMLEDQLGFRAWRYKRFNRAFLAENDTARAIYLVTITAEHRENDFGPSVPIEAAVDADTGRLLSQRPLALHVDGDARLYRENKAVASQMQSVTLPELLISDTLTHPLFNVYNCQKKARHLDLQGTYCRALATGSQNSFNFGYGTSEYDEVVSYAAITAAMEAFRTWDAQSLRSDWDQSKWPGGRNNFGLVPKSGQGSSSKQLSVFVNTETKSATTNRCNSDTTPDNAQYLWAGIDGSGQPEILIGYGGYGSPCGSLNELGKDFDVVMHEFGHHAVFRGLRNTTSQAVALHEGYSDYLTYAVSGNNLLAENSFPGRRALREGNITPGTTYFRFKRKSDGSYYTVKDYLSYPHLVGEFWSGILWEMRSVLGRASDGSYKMDKIVWDSIDLLKSDGGLVDGVMAISESAKRYGERFGDDAQGLQAAVHEIFVKYEFASLGGSGELIPTDALASVATGTTSSQKVRWGCGVVAQNVQPVGTDSSLNAFVIFAMLLAPLGLGGAARLRRVATQPIFVRHRTKSRKN